MALEVIGGAVAAPEVATALAGGVAVGSIAAALPVKQISREEAMQLGAAERAHFGGSVAAMHSAGVLESPFQNPAYVASLPTQAQLNAIHPNPIAMPPPALPTDHVTTYPGLAPPIDQLHLPGVPGHLGVDVPGIQELEARFVDSATVKAGMDVLARIAKCQPGFENFNSFAKLKDAIDVPPGWDAHHIVEQTRGTPLFGSQVIQSTSNIIALPEAVHDIVSSQYSSKYQDAAGNQYSHYRDFMEKQPYERQRTLGIKAVGDAINLAEGRGLISSDLADQLRTNLRNLDRPELCIPTPPKINPLDIPTVPEMNQHMNDHNQSPDRRLLEARSVSQWDGTTRSGTFLDIGDGRVAQHQGQGAYAVADVQRDLGGQQPPIGQYATLQQNGQVQVPQHTQTLQRG